MKAIEAVCIEVISARAVIISWGVHGRENQSGILEVC